MHCIVKITMVSDVKQVSGKWNHNKTVVKFMLIVDDILRAVRDLTTLWHHCRHPQPSDMVGYYGVVLMPNYLRFLKMDAEEGEGNAT